MGLGFRFASISDLKYVPSACHVQQNHEHNSHDDFKIDHVMHAFTNAEVDAVSHPSDIHSDTEVDAVSHPSRVSSDVNRTPKKQTKRLGKMAKEIAARDSFNILVLGPLFLSLCDKPIRGFHSGTEVFGMHCSIENWDTPILEALLEQYFAVKPRLVIVDPSFVDHFSEWPTHVIQFLDTFMSRLACDGVDYMIVDVQYTKRWQSPLIESICEYKGSHSHEFPVLHFCEGEGDIRFVTSSNDINAIMRDWIIKDDDQFHVPKCVDSLYDDSFFPVFEAMCREIKLTNNALAAFPAEMVDELINEREQFGSSMDAIYDETDVGEVPVGAQTHGEEQEIAMIEEIPLPGFPKNEAERRAKWARLPRRVRAAIRRLHVMLGHKPRNVLE